MARLASPEGRRLLAGLPEYDDATALAVMSGLRSQGVDPDLAGAALTQSRLRARGRARLGDLAGRLLLTQDGLEQATRPEVAARHAARFREAGVEHVWDLGSGLGLDSCALAGAGLSVTAVERDPVVATAAAANLHGHVGARVLQASFGAAAPGPDDDDDTAARVRLADLSPTDGAWLDPARRTPGVTDRSGRTRRVWRLEDLSPSWEDLQLVAARAAATGAKLSPGFGADQLPPGAEAEWVSVDGSVVECVVWWGRAVRRPGISAVVGTGDGRWTVVEPVTDPPPVMTSQDEAPAFLAEPDRAVLAAGMAGTLACLVEGQELSEGAGYVGSRSPREISWARWFEVLEELPLRAKPVRAALRRRGIDRVTLKKRGVRVDPDRFRTELRLGRGGDQEGILVLTSIGTRPVALLVRPLTEGR